MGTHPKPWDELLMRPTTFCPKTHGEARVEDRRMHNCIIFIGDPSLSFE